jgi:hypothetical protein
MKIQTLIFLLFSIVLLTNCTQNSVSVPTAANATINQEQEKAAILKTIEDESRFFYKKDHVSWSKFYVQSPKLHWICVEEGVSLRAKGWEDLNQFVATWMKENPDPIDYEKAEFKSNNAQVTIEGNMAFATMESSNIQPDGKVRYTVSSRTMLKENNTWKILSMTSYPNDSPKGSTANVYAHQ